MRCVHCGNELADETRDHVFPASWYPSTTPPEVQRWTVPSCTKCNGGLGKMERELFIRLAMSSSNLPLSCGQAVSKPFPFEPKEFEARVSCRPSAVCVPSHRITWRPPMTAGCAIELGCKRAPEPCKTLWFVFGTLASGKGVMEIPNRSPGRRQGRDKQVAVSGLLSSPTVWLMAAATVKRPAALDRGGRRRPTRKYSRLFPFLPLGKPFLAM
jgi:hypothetical protein